MERITDEKKIRKVMDECFEDAADLHKGESVKDFLPKLVNALGHPRDLRFLWEIKDFTSADDFTPALRAAWNEEVYASYREYEEPDFTKDEILDIFGACNPQELMTDYEYEMYQKLPAVITVYCGEYGMDNANPTDVVSWTTSIKEVVQNPDDRFGGAADAGGYMASIRKEDIIAYLYENGNEVLLNPDKLFDITYMKSMANLFSGDEVWDQFRRDCARWAKHCRDVVYGKLMKELTSLGRFDELIAATEDTEKLEALANEFGIGNWVKEI